MPRNKHPEETVKKILDASLKLFTEKGYEQTTILDIVNDLGGLTRGAFYHHFKSKEDVFQALINKLYDDNNPFEAIKDMQGASGLEKLKTVFSSSTGAQYPELMHTAMSLLRQPRFLMEHLRDTTEIAKMLEPLIQEGMADGSIRPGNAKFLAELALLITNVWLFSPIFPGDKAEILDRAKLMKQILDGLGFPVLDEGTMGIVDKVAEAVCVPPSSG